MGTKRSLRAIFLGAFIAIPLGSPAAAPVVAVDPGYGDLIVQMQANLQAACRLEANDRTKFLLNAGVDAGDRLQQYDAVLGDAQLSEDVQAKRTNAERLFAQMKTLQCPTASQGPPLAPKDHPQIAAAGELIGPLGSGVAAPGYFDGQVAQPSAVLAAGPLNAPFLSGDPHQAAVNAVLKQSGVPPPPPPSPADLRGINRQLSFLRSVVPNYQRDLPAGGLAAAAYTTLYQRSIDQFRATHGKDPGVDDLREIAARTERYTFGVPDTPWRRLVNGDNAQAMTDMDRQFRATMAMAAAPFGWTGAVVASVMMPGDGASPEQLSTQGIAARLAVRLLPAELRVPAQLAFGEARSLAGAERPLAAENPLAAESRPALAANKAAVTGEPLAPFFGGPKNLKELDDVVDIARTMGADDRYKHVRTAQEALWAMPESLFGRLSEYQRQILSETIVKHVKDNVEMDVAAQSVVAARRQALEAAVRRVGGNGGISLGLNTMPNRPQLLDEFANDVHAFNFHDWYNVRLINQPLNPDYNFIGPFRTAMDEAIRRGWKIRFNTEGMEDVFKSMGRGVPCPPEVRGNFTKLEVWNLLRKYMDHVSFYKYEGGHYRELTLQEREAMGIVPVVD